MTPTFERAMREATRLTQAGDLHAATAAIQAAIGGFAAPAAQAGSTPEIIDVEAREVRDGDAEDAAAPSAADGERFVAGRYHHASAGTRDYKLYVPPQAGTGVPLPLVVMLHGCTQDPDDFAAGTGMNEAARERGCFVLYPAQSGKANPSRCWNWFKHHHQQRGRGEPALLAALTRDVMQRHAVDPARVYAAGLSAGGAMAALLGATQPEMFAAIGVHSGLRAGAARDLKGAFDAMKSGAAPTHDAAFAPMPPTIVFHGDSDATVHPRNGEQAAAAAQRPGSAQRVDSQRLQSPNGRAFTRHCYRDTEGVVQAEHWVVHGAGHAWSGGRSAGSYTDPQGPDATAEMLRFFFAHTRR